MQPKKLFYKNNHVNFVITMIVLFFNVTMLTGVAVFLQKILDIAVNGRKNDIVHMFLVTVLYVLVLGCGWLLERYFRNRFIERAMKQFKDYIFEQLMMKNISSFGRESTSRYLSGLTNDMTSIEANYLQNDFGIIVNSFYFIMAISIMLWYHPQLTIFAIVMVFLSFIVSLLTGGKLAEREKCVSIKNEHFVGLVKDLLNGFPVIKSFQAESEVTQLFAQDNTNLEREKCKRRKSEAMINLVGTSMGFLIQASVALFGAYLAIRGQITPGVLVAFIQLMNFIIQPIQQIPPALANRKAATGLISKLEEAVAESKTSVEEIALERDVQEIRLKGVNFGYEKEKPILKNIDLTFQQGKSYAIVGASGCGKSTILNLLLGGYSDYRGSITINQKELRNISRDKLYDALAIVQQNVFVFDNTIQNNITMFKDFGAEKLQKVLGEAGLNKLIEEKGITYRCGENGNALSGGEKQRISIARSLLKEPSLLLMDEATSALDAETASMIEQMVLAREGLIRIVVTHKLHEATLRKYDQIIVLREGQVLSVGTFDELMQNCFYFEQLLQA